MAIGDRLMNRIEARIESVFPEGVEGFMGNVRELVIVGTEIGKDVAKIIDDWQVKGGIPLEIPLAEGVFKARVPLKGDDDE